MSKIERPLNELIITKDPIDVKHERSLDPLANLLTTMVNFIKRIKNVDEVEAGKIALKVIERDVKDPIIQVYIKDEKRDKQKVNMTLTKYLKRSYKLGETIAPSLTTYTKSGEDGGTDSLIKAFTDERLALRSQVKKEAAQAYAAKNYWRGAELTDEQKIIKLINNAFSGAFASPGTPHYNPSAHYSLTSTTRTISSLGNILTEQVSGGNRIYLNPEMVWEDIIGVVSWADKELYTKAIKKFKLAIPTVEDIISMIRSSTQHYFDSDKHFAMFTDYISKLDDVEKCMVLYNNDLYHFDKLNKEVSHDLILGIGRKCCGLVSDKDCAEYVDKQEDWKVNLATHICMDELRGKEVKTKVLKGTPALNYLASTLLNINQELARFDILLTALLGSSIIPVGIGKTKLMTRKVIVLSDTDSTCGSYGHWVTNVLGKDDFTSKGVSVSATVMTLVSLSLAKAINQFTTNMNVGTNSKGKLKMKNEFYWPVFAIGTGTKHYYASVEIQEGFVFEEKQLELKGSQFINSKSPLFYREESKKLHIDVMNDITAGVKIDTHKYLKRVYDIETELIQQIMKGDLDILESGTIKSKGQYKNPSGSPYQHYVLWKEVFEDKYGVVPEPPYSFLKFSLNVSGKSDIKNFLDSFEDKSISDKFRIYLDKHGKDKITNILLPEDIVNNTGVPEELLKHVDYKKIVISCCRPMYLTLGTIGVKVSPKKTIHDMV